MALACGEVYIDALKADALKECVDELGADVAALDFESQRVDTLVEDVERFGIGSLGIIGNDVLTHAPYIVVFLVTTHKRELTRQSIGGGKTLDVFSAVERLHVEALIGSPYQLLVEVCSLQVNLNLVKPFLFCRSLKLGKEFFFAI